MVNPTIIDNSQARALPPPESAVANTALDFLLPSLLRLDHLLEWATRALQTQRPETSTPFRGLYISSEDVARGLSQSPGASPFAAGMPPTEQNHIGDSSLPSPLAQLIQRFGLTSFDADILILSIAPEIDLRYERVYAYLQDDVTRKRPTVELALNLFCVSPQEKLERRSHFSPDSLLVRNGLLHLLPDPNQVEPSFLAYYLKPDEQIIRLLLGDASLDSRLAPFCELTQPAPDWHVVPLSNEIKSSLASLVQQAHTDQQPLRLYFQGTAGTGKSEAAQALAAHLGMKLLSVAADRLLGVPGTASLLKLVFRESLLHHAVLHITSLDSLTGQGAEQRLSDLLSAAAQHEGIMILSGQNPWRPQMGSTFGVKPLAFNVLGFTESLSYWKTELENRGIALESHALEMLASRFRLSSGQIKNSVASAQLNSQWNAAGNSAQTGTADMAPSLDELCTAARAQCGHELQRLSAKVEPHYKWDDIVLPPDQMDYLREICAQAEYRNVVYGDWGFDRKLSLGKGLNVLFTGPPGTGKTMSAEVIAHELQLDLYRIDLSQVVSKYIGESEKNLEKIFCAAENSNAILFFDEADALFGKRSEVRDSHDRYANIEISYLLQKMEEYQGISILATNLRQNLDDAFMRRLQAVVEFPFPDQEYRARIWKNVFPKEAPLAEDVNFDVLAHEIQLAGGNIKNMALAAAFYAAGDGGVIRMKHLIQAAHREHQKVGRSWNDAGLRKKAA